MFSVRPVVEKVLEHFSKVRRLAGQKWNVLGALTDGFRIAWVSTASVIAAMVLLVYLPQGRDLFLDVRGSRGIGVLFWVAFYLGVLLVWLLPVYVSSCWILKCYPAGGPTGNRALAYWVRDTVPRVLVVLGLAAILAGQVGAVAEAPYILDSTNIERNPKKEILYILAFIFAVFLLANFRVWLFERYTSFADMRAWRINTRGLVVTLSMFMAVLVIGADLNNFAKSAKEVIDSVSENYLPRNVNNNFVVFVVVSFWAIPAGYLLSFVRYRIVQWFAAVLLLLGDLVILIPAIAFIAWLVAYDLKSRIFGLAEFEAAAPLGIGHLAILPPITLFLTHLAWVHLQPARDAPVLPAIAVRTRRMQSALQSLRENFDRPFGALLLISIAIIGVHICLSPVLVTDVIYRALLVPFVLGLLVPILTFISFWSFRWHAPIVLAAVAILAFAAPDADDVRTLNKEAERPTLDESVLRWKTVNNCVPAAADPTLKCPSPIIIAAAGGASRSAFLVGSVVGKLLDEKTSASGHGLHPFDQQLFAISGVSGGALGAAVTYAAIADSVRAKGASRNLGNPPCKRGAHDTEWFAPHIRSAIRPDTSWHDCLQLILSGDFLSPVLASLVSGDLVGITPFGDRAAVLESAWEQRYARLTGQSNAGSGLPSTMASSLTGLRQRGLDASPEAWLPMLLLTGTSVSTGRRILTSDVDTLLAGTLNKLRGRLFHDAYDLHELISPPLGVHEAAFSPDGKSLLLWYTEDTKIRIFDAETGAARKQFEAGPAATIEALWSPDSQYILSWTNRYEAKLWRASTGEVIETFPELNTVMAKPSFAADSRTLLIAYQNKVSWWDLETGREARQFNTQNLDNAALLQNGQVLLTRSNEEVVLSRTGSNQEFARFGAASVNLTLDGLGIVGCQRNQPAVVRDPSSGEPLSTIEGLACYGGMKLSRDRRLLLVDRLTSNGRSAQVFSLEPKGSLLFETEFDNRIAAFSPDGKWLLYAPSGKPIALRDLQTGAEKQVPGTADESRGEVLFSQDGRFAVMWQKSWLGRGGVKVIDIAASAVLPEIRGQEGWVDGAIFHPVSERVFTWSDNGTIRLWDIVKGEEKFVSRGTFSASRCSNCDIRLSTAATMSARFPIISPHGTLRSGGRLVDRVVDGGYFENFGALTALELADELRTYGLDPRIILINNEPSAAGMSCLSGDSQLDMPNPIQRITFSTFRSPIMAMWATRSARGTHAAVDLCSRAGGRENFAFVTVKQNGRFADAELPMSWWLSKHAQQYLDAQIDTNASDSNGEAFRNIERWRRLPDVP
ncbi:MAG: WD40 repeat domain-containing protein [Hyphomicrobium sp.]